MANFYYVTATAPATVLVSGRRFNLSPGDTRGPFSENELQQIMSGPDRNRLVSTKTVAPESKKPPEVKPTYVNGMGVVLDRPVEEVSPTVPSEGKSYEESAKAPSMEAVEPVGLTASFRLEEPVAPPAETQIASEIPDQFEPGVTSTVIALDPEPLDKPEEVDELDELSKSNVRKTRRARKSPLE